MTFGTKLYPYLLFIFTILISLILSVITIYRFHGSFTTIPVRHTDNFVMKIDTNDQSESIDSITGEVKAVFNNFGTISLSVETQKWIETKQEKNFKFKIKEKGSMNWIATNYYKTNNFYKVENFPFGFEPQINSAGKIYYFELIAENGNYDSPLILSAEKPYIDTKYKFSKVEILSNPSTFKLFVEHKIIRSFMFNEIKYAVILFSLLPVSYLLYASKRKFLKKIVFIMFVFSFYLYIFVLPVKNDLAFVSILINWLLISNLNKIHTKVTFAIAMFLFSAMFILLITKNTEFAERTSEFVYGFFAIAIFLEAYRLLRKK